MYYCAGYWYPFTNTQFYYGHLYNIHSTFVRLEIQCVQFVHSSVQYMYCWYTEYAVYAVCVQLCTDMYFTQCNVDMALRSVLFCTK